MGVWPARAGRGVWLCHPPSVAVQSGLLATAGRRAVGFAGYGLPTCRRLYWLRLVEVSLDLPAAARRAVVGLADDSWSRCIDFACEAWSKSRWIRRLRSFDVAMALRRRWLVQTMRIDWPKKSAPFYSEARHFCCVFLVGLLECVLSGVARRALPASLPTRPPRLARPLNRRVTPLSCRGCPPHRGARHVHSTVRECRHG